MAKNDAATLVINSGNYLTAPVGTAMPADLRNPGSEWENVGHTALDEVFSLSSEGGEATILGTLQNKNLRTVYSPRSESFAFTLQQFDESSLRLYFGANAPTLADGSIGVPQNPVPTKCAFLVVFVDGDNVFAFYAPKAEVFRGDDMSLADTESLAGLPLSVKPMALEGNDYTYAITPLGATVLTATGATSGAPGSFTPQGASAPANLADMTDVIASPQTAWLSGQYVELGDGTDAHWDGTNWVAGIAV